MNAEIGRLLIAVGAVLVVVGAAMVCASAKRANRRQGRAVGSVAGLSDALTCTSVVCGVITGVQWAVLDRTGPGVAWVVVLCLPAFLAGATVTRLFGVVRNIYSRRRFGRASLRNRGSSR